MRKFFTSFPFMMLKQELSLPILKRIFASIFLFVLVVPVGGQYKNIGSGDFDDPANWDQNGKPIDDWKTITIIADTEITKTGDFQWHKRVTVDGDFLIHGACVGGDGEPSNSGITVNGKLEIICEKDLSGRITAGNNATINVGGDFSGILKALSGLRFTVNKVIDGSLEIGEKAEVSVGSIENGVIDAGKDTKVSINGDCTLTNHSIIRSGASVIVYGDLNLNSNIIVEQGATLIVHGDFDGAGNWRMTVSGNMIVKGNFSASNGTIQNNGNVVVGGDVSITDGDFIGSNDNFYAINPNAEVTTPEWGSDKNPGNWKDFIELGS